MPNIDWYLDEARARARIESDNALSHRLGMAKQAVNQWRSRKAWPTDGTMVKLAELAGISPLKALADLNSWRTKDEKARAVYLDLAAKAFVLILAIFVSNSNAVAAAINENNLAVSRSQLYIMRDLGLEFRQRFIHKSLVFRHPCAAPLRTPT